MTEDQNTKDLTDRELLELMRDARFTALEADIKEIKRDLRQLRDHDWKHERDLTDMNERVERPEDRVV